MNPLDGSCREVVAVARGDHRDPIEIQRHLERCDACRDEVREIQAMTSAVRAVMKAEPSPAAYRIATVEKARAARSAGVWSWQFALGVTAAAALTFLLVSETNRDAGAPPPGQLRVELEATPHGHVHYVVHGADGARRYGGIELTHPTVPETVDLDTVVADTF